MDIRIEPVESGRKVFTVTEITRNIRFTLEDRFSSVWVGGEISNFTHHSSGHMYFSIKDSESSLQCVMFRQENTRLRFRPENGLAVNCRGRVSVYAQRGQYQLLAQEMEPRGYGELQLAFEQLRARLAAEGLFDPARKRKMPFLPRAIGIVTSPTGAVIRDMLNVLGRRFPGMRVLVRPARVQGEGAAAEIAQGIRDLNEYGGIDVLVLARGGGSLEDLWAFNEEGVARAIVASKIPVVSAVGHEVDYTIADFAADLRAPTPSAAAEMLVPNREDLLGEIGRLKKDLGRAVAEKIASLKEEIGAVLSSRAFRGPLEMVRENRIRVDEVAQDLGGAARRRVGNAREALHALAGKLEALSPLGCLLRGYSITWSERGAVVKSARSVSRGERIRTRFSDGIVTSRVEEDHEER